MFNPKSSNCDSVQKETLFTNEANNFYSATASFPDTHHLDGRNPILYSSNPGQCSPVSSSYVPNLPFPASYSYTNTAGDATNYPNPIITSATSRSNNSHVYFGRSPHTGHNIPSKHENKYSYQYLPFYDHGSNYNQNGWSPLHFSSFNHTENLSYESNFTTGSNLDFQNYHIQEKADFQQPPKNFNQQILNFEENNFNTNCNNSEASTQNHENYSYKKTDDNFETTVPFIPTKSNLPLDCETEARESKNTDYQNEMNTSGCDNEIINNDEKQEKSRNNHDKSLLVVSLPGGQPLFSVPLKQQLENTPKRKRGRPPKLKPEVAEIQSQTSGNSRNTKPRYRRGKSHLKLLQAAPDLSPRVATVDSLQSIEVETNFGNYLANQTINERERNIQSTGHFPCRRAVNFETSSEQQRTSVEAISTSKSRPIVSTMQCVKEKSNTNLFYGEMEVANVSRNAASASFTREDYMSQVSPLNDFSRKGARKMLDVQSTTSQLNVNLPLAQSKSVYNTSKEDAGSDKNNNFTNKVQRLNRTKYTRTPLNLMTRMTPNDLHSACHQGQMHAHNLESIPTETAMKECGNSTQQCIDMPNIFDSEISATPISKDNNIENTGDDITNKDHTLELKGRNESTENDFEQMNQAENTKRAETPNSSHKKNTYIRSFLSDSSDSDSDIDHTKNDDSTSFQNTNPSKEMEPYHKDKERKQGSFRLSEAVHNCKEDGNESSKVELYDESFQCKTLSPYARNTKQQASFDDEISLVCRKRSFSTQNKDSDSAMRNNLRPIALEEMFEQMSDGAPSDLQTNAGESTIALNPHQMHPMEINTSVSTKNRPLSTLNVDETYLIPSLWEQFIEFNKTENNAAEGKHDKRAIADFSKRKCPQVKSMHTAAENDTNKSAFVRVVSLHSQEMKVNDYNTLKTLTTQSTVLEKINTKGMNEFLIPSLNQRPQSSSFCTPNNLNFNSDALIHDSALVMHGHHEPDIQKLCCNNTLSMGHLKNEETREKIRNLATCKGDSDCKNSSSNSRILKNDQSGWRKVTYDDMGNPIIKRRAHRGHVPKELLPKRQKLIDNVLGPQNSKPDSTKPKSKVGSKPQRKCRRGTNSLIKKLIKFSQYGSFKMRGINKTKSKLNADLNKVFILGSDTVKRKSSCGTGKLKEIKLDIPGPMERRPRASRDNLAKKESTVSNNQNHVVDFKQKESSKEKFTNLKPEHSQTKTLDLSESKDKDFDKHETSNYCSPFPLNHENNIPQQKSGGNGDMEERQMKEIYEGNDFEDDDEDILDIHAERDSLLDMFN